MSLPVHDSIQCPNCGAEVEVTVFQSINDQWPDAIQNIMTGKLFEFVCPQCGRKDHLEYDILVNDFKDRAWVQVVHEDSMIPAHVNMLEATGKFMSETRMRIVHNTLELREKIIAFHFGRDDRIIELCKLAIPIIARQQMPDYKPSGTPYYTFNPETGQEAFALPNEDGKQMIALLDDRLYNEMEKRFLQLIESGQKRYIYDFDWAQEILADN